jgi:hypothetical protein
MNPFISLLILILLLFTTSPSALASCAEWNLTFTVNNQSGDDRLKIPMGFGLSDLSTNFEEAEFVGYGYLTQLSAISQAPTLSIATLEVHKVISSTQRMENMSEFAIAMG